MDNVGIPPFFSSKVEGGGGFLVISLLHGSGQLRENEMKLHVRKSNIKKIRKSGFRARMATRGGRKVLSRRRFQGKKRLTNV